MQVQMIKTTVIDADPDNARRGPTKDADAELMASVKAQGILAALLVRPKGSKFEVVAGHRRLAAAIAAGLDSVPCQVRDMTDGEAKEAQLVENLQREDLEPLEEAEAYSLLLKKGVLLEELATRTGKPKGYIHRRTALLTLSVNVRQALTKGLPVVFAERLLKLSLEQQDKLLERIHGKQRHNSIDTLADLEEALKEAMLLLVKAPFSRKDPELVPKAGACLNCPKRTGAQADLLGETEKDDTCLDGKCYSSKIEAHNAQVLEKAKAAGKEIITGKKADDLNNGYSHGTGLTKLDEHDYDLAGENTTWRQALTKAKVLEKVQVIVAADSRGRVKEYIKEADAKKHLPPAALKSYARPKSSQVSGAEQARKTKELIEERARPRATAELATKIKERLKAQNFGSNQAFLFMLKLVVERLEHDNRTAALKRLVLAEVLPKDTKTNSFDGEKALLKYMDANANKPEALKEVLAEVVAGAGLGSYTSEPGGLFALGLKFCGLQWAPAFSTAQASVRAERAAKVKGKKVPAPKGKK